MSFHGSICLFVCLYSFVYSLHAYVESYFFKILLDSHCDTPKFCIDFSRALARCSAMSPAVQAFLGVGVAEPLIPGVVELSTVDPQVGVRAGIGAQFFKFASSFAATARRSLFVRST